MERMARWLAHQLNNPLATISGSAQLLERAQGPSPTASGQSLNYPDMIRQEATRCSALLNEVAGLCTAREPDLAPLDLRSLAEESLRRSLQRCDPEGVRVDVEPSPGSSLVMGDPVMLSRAVEALLDNALQAMAEGGNLALAVRLSPDHPGHQEVIVTDTGEGMGPETLSRLFEPFFTERRRFRGLGLTLCHQAAEAHRGALAFRSSPGKGTTARLILPAGFG
jgi:signal transduction histidine kinase